MAATWLKRLLIPQRPALTAAARIVSAIPDREARAGEVMASPAEWENEAWGFYDRQGPYRNAVTWKADMIGRVRLRAAKLLPEQDEPEIEETGPAAEIVRELTPDVQTQIMSGLSVYLTVPGIGYLIGETIDGRNNWTARSYDEVRYHKASSGTAAAGVSPWQVIREDQPPNAKEWRSLAAESLVVRVWRPHRRFYNVPDSNSRSALDSMREVELANRKIQAQYLSRLASAGLVIFPTEVEFPVRAEFMTAADPFVSQWIALAAEAIGKPGAASSMVPMPIRVPGEYVDKVRFVDFTTILDEHDVERRDSAMRQLAIDLDVPPQALLGLEDVNHWTGWLIEESGFKVYLAPDIETICGALTKGYLRPRLEAAGVDPAEYVMWYDASEITQRPDKSANAKDAYDRGEISGTALRRELGMDEGDTPTDDELADMILFKLATQPATASSALKTLTGVDIGPTTPPGGAEVPVGGPVASGESGGPGRHIGPPKGGMPARPPEENIPPMPVPGPKPGADLEQDPRLTRINRLAHLATLPHALRIDATGRRVLHPAECGTEIASCPFTYGTWSGQLAITPGTPGVYACVFNDRGQAIIGQRLYDGDVDTMLPGLRVNGATRS